VALGDEAGEVRLWDPVTARQRRRYADWAHSVYALAYAPDGKSLAAASRHLTLASVMKAGGPSGGVSPLIGVSVPEPRERQRNRPAGAQGRPAYFVDPTPTPYTAGSLHRNLYSKRKLVLGAPGPQGEPKGRPYGGVYVSTVKE
jgi:hypothetical protein